jgi:hypothetical protein
MSIYTEATQILGQIRQRLQEAANMPMPPAETGGLSLAGTSPEPQEAGSGQDTPAYTVGAVNVPDVSDTFEKYVASLIAGLMEKHGISIEDAEGLVFGTIEDYEEQGLLPAWPGEDAADANYLAAFLGRAKSVMLHNEILRRAEQEYPGD